MYASQKLIIEPFEKVYEKLLYFLPNLFTSIFLLIVGLIVGLILKAVFLKILRTLNVDRHCERVGLFQTLSKNGIKDPVSVLVSRVVWWITIITFAVVSMQNLRIPTVEHLLDRFFLYLPAVFLAAFILIVGYLLANFFGRAALIGSVNAGMKYSGLIAKAVRFTILILSVAMALEQLGIGSDTIQIAFAIAFGGVVLAFAIACGLGGQGIARDYFVKKVSGDDSKDDLDHL
jgi:hypothetical protein